MKVQEQREIIEAYERGDEIKWKYYYEDSFEHVASKELCDEHQFDFVNRVYRIKKKRWRAEKGEWYYYLTLDLNVREINSDAHDFFAQVNIDVIDNVVNVEVNYVQEYDKLITNEENNE